MTDPDLPEFDELAELARSVGDEDRVRREPPAHVWQNIEASIDDASPESTDRTDAPGSLPPLDNVRDISRPKAANRPRYASKLLAGVAASIVLIAAFTLFDSGGQSDIDTLVAEATNADLPEQFDGTATATVEVDDSPTIELEFSTEIPGEEQVEAWLGTPDDATPISLGLVPAGSTEWSSDWPAGADPATYTVVWLTIESDDDPAPSGRTILRGEFKPI